MKKTSKILALVLVVAMVVAMGVGTVAFATDVPSFGDNTVTTDNLFTYTGDDKATGSSIKLTNATKDTKYTMYKIFDATYEGDKVSYTIQAGALKNELSKAEWADYVTIGATADANGNFSVSRKMDGDNPVKTDTEFITKIQALNTSLLGEVGAIKSTVNGAIEWKDLPYGYYMIVPDKPTEPKAAVTIDSNVPTVEVIDKNQTSSFEKNIVTTASGKEQLEKAVDATLNEDVDYRISVQASNYDKDEKIFKYVVSDTLDKGMTYKALPPVITVDDTAVPAADITYVYKDKNGNAVAVTGTPTAEQLKTIQSFEATIKWTNDGTKAGTHIYPSNSTLTVEYSAYLDPDKANDLVVGGGSDANTNTAEVKYFKGKDDGSPDETTPSGDLGDSKTDTYTTELTILKTDGTNPLTGAEFTLTGPTGTVVITSKDVYTVSASGEYWKLKDGTYTQNDPETPGMDTSLYEDTSIKYAKSTETEVVGAGQTNTVIKAMVGDDGTVTFTGLAAGDYTLVESIVPNGYNKIDDITFTIAFDPTYTKDSNDKITGWNGKFTVTPTTAGITVESDNTLYTRIVNNSGSELPETGGIGTTIFYVVGAILVVGAVVILVTRRRMRAR